MTKRQWAWLVLALTLPVLLQLFIASDGPLTTRLARASYWMIDRSR